MIVTRYLLSYWLTIISWSFSCLCSYYDIEMMIQAATIVFLNKGSVCHWDYKSFLEAIRYNCYCLETYFTYISGKHCIKHLLWALTFLKKYSCEQALSRTADCKPKTFRKRVLEVLTALNNQYNDVVSTKFTIFNSLFWCIKSNFF